jgi:hypothetical protein
MMFFGHAWGLKPLCAPKRAGGRITAIKANLTILADGPNATLFKKVS